MNFLQYETSMFFMKQQLAKDDKKYVFKFALADGVFTALNADEFAGVDAGAAAAASAAADFRAADAQLHVQPGERRVPNAGGVWRRGAAGALPLVAARGQPQFRRIVAHRGRAARQGHRRLPQQQLQGALPHPRALQILQGQPRQAASPVARGALHRGRKAARQTTRPCRQIQSKSLVLTIFFGDASVTNFY